MAGSQKTACVEIGGIPIALSTSDDRFLDLCAIVTRDF